MSAAFLRAVSVQATQTASVSRSRNSCLAASVFACAASLPLAASGGSYRADAPMNVPAVDTRATPPLRTLNPSPKRAFEFRVVLDNAPGPFAVVEATAQFDVGNAAQCGRLDPISGAVPTIASHEPFALTRVSDTEYVGTLHADAILDEDYYGRGVCRWALTEARVSVRAHDDPADTRFVAGLPAQHVLGGGSKTRNFWKGYYPRFEQGGSADFGREHLQAVPVDKRDEFFTITLAAHEISP